LDFGWREKKHFEKDCHNILSLAFSALSENKHPVLGVYVCVGKKNFMCSVFYPKRRKRILRNLYAGCERTLTITEEK